MAPSELTPADVDNPGNSGDQIRVNGVSGSVVAAGRGAIALGSGAQVIIRQALTAAEEARAQQDYEGAELAKAIAGRMSDLHSLSVQHATREGDTNPYKSLRPYELSDAGQFFGREAVIRDLLGEIQGESLGSRFAVLVGETAVGKTSLLQAGILPALVAAQHLPLLVRVGNRPLPEAIKTSLLPDLSATPGLQRLSLREFFARITKMLPAGKHVYVLLDQFENFFDSTSGVEIAGASNGDLVQNHRVFAAELSDSLFTTPPSGHWLVSMRSASQGNLRLVFQQPTRNTTILSPLSRAEASSAILLPADLHGYRLDDGLLDMLLNDLGPEVIDPARLQLVCYRLVEASPAGEKLLTCDTYTALGKAQHIWSKYLDDTLKSIFVPELRPPTWAALAVVAEAGSPVATQKVIETLEQEGLPPDKAQSVLGTLEGSYILRQSESGYQLGSPAFKNPIRDWSMRRAALAQARLEARRQVEKIRDSALRGLLGGGIGMFLAVLVTYWDQIDNKIFLAFIAAYDILPGAVAGFLLVLSVDLVLASYTGSKRWRIWPAGALAGGLAFTLMLLAHVAFTEVGQNPLGFFGVIAEGMLWGAAAGVSALLATGTRRPLWQSLLITAVVCGVSLVLGEWIGGAFQSNALSLGVFIAGAILPVMIVLLAAAGRRASWQDFEAD
jgi:hypothetical protein